MTTPCDWNNSTNLSSNNNNNLELTLKLKRQVQNTYAFVSLLPVVWPGQQELSLFPLRTTEQDEVMRKKRRERREKKRREGNWNGEHSIAENEGMGENRE